jgi:hypothetical protein
MLGAPAFLGNKAVFTQSRMVRAASRRRSLGVQRVEQGGGHLGWTMRGAGGASPRACGESNWTAQQGGIFPMRWTAPAWGSFGFADAGGHVNWGSPASAARDGCLGDAVGLNWPGVLVCGLYPTHGATTLAARRPAKPRCATQAPPQG